MQIMDEFVKAHAFEATLIELQRTTLSSSQILIIAPTILKKYLTNYVDSIRANGVLPFPVDESMTRMLLNTWTKDFLVQKFGYDLTQPNTQLPTFDNFYRTYVGQLIDAPQTPTITLEVTDVQSIEPLTPKRRNLLKLLTNRHGGS
jgi:hypothetical protein